MLAVMLYEVKFKEVIQLPPGSLSQDAAEPHKNPGTQKLPGETMSRYHMKVDRDARGALAVPGPESSNSMSGM